MKNKKIILGMSVLALGSVVLTTGCGKEVNISKKAAVGVKGAEITANDFYKEIKEDNITTLIDMIDHKLFDEEYKTTDKENEYVADQINQIKSYYPEDEQFKQVIKQYFGADSEKELKKMFALEYKRQQAVHEAIEKKISDSEIEDYYNNELHADMGAKHILITPDVKSDATPEEKEAAEQKAYEEAKKIISKLDSGKNWDSLAKKYSDDKSNSDKGGDLGVFAYDEMVEAFSQACEAQEVNTYSKEPVKTSYGYHIIFKTSQEEKAKLEDKKDEIKEKLRDRQLEQDSKLYTRTLKEVREEKGIIFADSKLKKAYDKYMDDLLDENN